MISSKHSGIVFAIGEYYGVTAPQFMRAGGYGVLYSAVDLPMEPMMQETLIQSNPSIMMGKPVVTGTRVSVELILEKLGSGETIEQLLEAHPRLTREGVLAAIRFGAAALRADVSYPVPELVS
jgi:uncharacterized protein (DUF433 family)